jgi:hypothetical protein
MYRFHHCGGKNQQADASVGETFIRKKQKSKIQTK